MESPACPCTTAAAPRPFLPQPAACPLVGVEREAGDTARPARPLPLRACGPGAARSLSREGAAAPPRLGPPAARQTPRQRAPGSAAPARGPRQPGAAAAARSFPPGGRGAAASRARPRPRRAERRCRPARRRCSGSREAGEDGGGGVAGAGAHAEPTAEDVGALRQRAAGGAQRPARR